MSTSVQGLGFRVQGLGFRVQGWGGALAVRRVRARFVGAQRPGSTPYVVCFNVFLSLCWSLSSCAHKVSTLGHQSHYIEHFSERTGEASGAAPGVRGSYSRAVTSPCLLLQETRETRDGAFLSKKPRIHEPDRGNNGTEERGRGRTKETAMPKKGKGGAAKGKAAEAKPEVARVHVLSCV